MLNKNEELIYEKRVAMWMNFTNYGVIFVFVGPFGPTCRIGLKTIYLENKKNSVIILLGN